MKYSDYQLEDFLADELFIKWIRDKDPHISDFWQKWLAANPEKAEIMEEAARIIRSVEYRDHYELTEREYVSLYEDIMKRTEVGAGRLKKRMSTGRIAAIITLTIVGVLGLLLGLEDQEPPSEVISEVRMIKKTTLPGQKLTFKLPDGTRVKLNASSSVEFPDRFTSHSRGVMLIGEAFFQVVEDPARPFTVESRDFSTTALGTSFNVFAYSDENRHRVSLVSGKVKVESIHSPDGARILQPGEQVTYNKQEDIFSVQLFDAFHTTGWVDGILTFKDSKFSDVISALERWYGVQIDVLNENKKRTDEFSGTFSNENLEKVLEVLSFSGGFAFRIEGKSVVIEFID